MTSTFTYLFLHHWQLVDHQVLEFELSFLFWGLISNGPIKPFDMQAVWSTFLMISKEVVVEGRKIS